VDVVCRWQLIELSTSGHEMFVRRLTTKSPSAVGSGEGFCMKSATKSWPKYLGTNTQKP